MLKVPYMKLQGRPLRRTLELHQTDHYWRYSRPSLGSQYVGCPPHNQSMQSIVRHRRQSFLSLIMQNRNFSQCRKLFRLIKLEGGGKLQGQRCMVTHHMQLWPRRNNLPMAAAHGIFPSTNSYSCCSAPS